MHSYLAFSEEASYVYDSTELSRQELGLVDAFESSDSTYTGQHA